MAEVRQAPPKLPDEPSTAALVQDAAEQISRLVRDELRLARVELAEKGRSAGLGAGLLGGGGVVAMYGVTALLVAVGLALAEIMPGWLAAALLGVGLLLVAAGLAMAGRGRVQGSMPPVPEEAMGRVRQDIGTVRSAARRRGQR